jgi:hypothetical protein
MVERIFAQYGWITPHTPCNYLLLSYEPQARITLGTSFTDQFLCGFAPSIGWCMHYGPTVTAIASICSA